jgi:hypothetical protein
MPNVRIDDGILRLTARKPPAAHPHNARDLLDRHGCIRSRTRLDAATVEAIGRDFDAALSDTAAGARSFDLGEAVLATLIASPPVREMIEVLLGPRAVAVRALAFRKSRRVNWHVAWHQDMTVALSRCVDGVAGFGQWTTKCGVPHAVAPRRLLERMVTARVHLDEVAATDGPLEILPGSHRAGRLPARDLRDRAPSYSANICLADAGEIHIFRPLLAHRSKRATGDSSRRIVQIEFAPPDALPPPLSWHRAQAI